MIIFNRNITRLHFPYQLFDTVQAQIIKWKLISLDYELSNVISTLFEHEKALFKEILFKTRLLYNFKQIYWLQSWLLIFFFSYRRYWLITKRLKVVIWKAIGNSCHQRKLRTQLRRNQKTGMTDQQSMIQMTRNQKTGTNQCTYPTQMPRNQKIGMMKWTVNGNHQWLTIQNTKANGNQNKSTIRNTRWNLFVYIFVTCEMLILFNFIIILSSKVSATFLIIISTLNSSFFSQNSLICAVSITHCLFLYLPLLLYFGYREYGYIQKSTIPSTLLIQTYTRGMKFALLVSIYGKLRPVQFSTASWLRTTFKQLKILVRKSGRKLT